MTTTDDRSSSNPQDDTLDRFDCQCRGGVGQINAAYTAIVCVECGGIMAVISWTRACGE